MLLFGPAIRIDDTSQGGPGMRLEENKDLIRRYIEAIDDNQTGDWSVLDEYIAEDFAAHNPPIPGVSLDREGMKQAAEILRVATPGRHEIRMQVAEGDLVVSHVVGRGIHAGELLGIPQRTRTSRLKASRFTASATTRSSNTGRSQTSRACCSRWARSPRRTNKR
jgi:predicted ester cyclase